MQELEKKFITPAEVDIKDNVVKPPAANRNPLPNKLSENHFRLSLFNNPLPEDLPLEGQVNDNLPPDDLPPECPDYNNLPPEDLPSECPANSNQPPNDSPPECPTDLQILGDQGCKILVRLTKRLEEFNDNGKALSEKISLVSPLLEERLSNLGIEKISKMEDGGVALTQFVHHVQASLYDLSKFSNPFPFVTEIIEKKPAMSFSDILFTYNLIWDSIVNPEKNVALKMRAISCTLLTLAYDKLQKSLIDISDFSNLLILSMQRITRLGLFANDALKDFTALYHLNGLITVDKQVIKNAIDHLQDLKCRSQQLGCTMNEIQATLAKASMYLPEYKRYSEDAISLLEATKNFVGVIIEFIMEQKFQDQEVFEKSIKDKIQNEFITFVDKQVISLSDKMYFEFKKYMSQTKSNRIEEIDNLKMYLNSIHENDLLSDDEKLIAMMKTIDTTQKKISDTFGATLFSPRRSYLVDELSLFICNHYNNYFMAKENIRKSMTL